MSAMTLFSGSNIAAIPDYLRGTDDFTKTLAGGGGSVKAISIRGGVWRLMDGKEEIAKNEDRAMQFIIVNAAPKVSRTFYLAKYEEGKDISPTCWSADGVKPNEEVPADQKQASLCATCPQNIEGSGEGKSRACRFSQRLAVSLVNDIEGGVYRLQLPAKSLFGKADGDKMPLQAYAKFLAGHGVPISGVVTEARFDTSEAVPVLKFRAVRPLTKDEFMQVRMISESEEALRAIEMKVVIKEDNAETAPAPEPAPVPVTVKKAKPKPAPMPVVEEVDEEAEEAENSVVSDSGSSERIGFATHTEPVVKKAKPAPAPAVAPAGGKTVASLLSSWGDDDDDE